MPDEIAARPGLPRSTVLHLYNAGVKATHVGDRGLATDSDAEILEVARHERSVVVTLDADFHTLLALSGARDPSVIRIRIEGLRAERLASLLVDVLKICANDLMKGAAVSVTESGVRIRNLPLLRAPWHNRDVSAGTAQWFSLSAGHPAGEGLLLFLSPSPSIIFIFLQF